MSINVLSLSLPLPLSTLPFLSLPPWSCTYHSPTAIFPFGCLHDQSVSQNEFINSDQVLSNKLGHVGDTIITVVSNNWSQLLDINLAVLCSAAIREQSYNGDPSLPNGNIWGKWEGIATKQAQNKTAGSGFPNWHLPVLWQVYGRLWRQKGDMQGQSGRQHFLRWKFPQASRCSHSL